MKKIFYILASAIVALGAVACDNQDLDSINPNAKGEGLTINATINTTKVVFDELTATSWEEGDFVTIGDFTFDYIADEDVFRCDDAESMNLVGQTLPATANALNSAAGIKGSTFAAAAQEIKEGVNFVFDLSSALVKYTTTTAAVTFEGSALSAAVSAVKDGNTQYIAVKAGEEVTLTCKINKNAHKNITTTFEAGKIYNLGNIEMIFAGSGKGTADDPYDVTRALDIIKNGAYTTDNVYTKGIISTIKSVDTGSYGNAEYSISVDGTTTNELVVYRGKYLNGEKFTSKDQILVSDEVVVCGQLTNYNGTYEYTSNSKIVSLKRTKLVMSEITCANAGEAEDSLTFNWTTVENATGYEVTFDNTLVGTIEETTYTATGLVAGTSHTISVKAVADGVNYKTSEAKTCTANTKAGEDVVAANIEIPFKKASMTTSVSSYTTTWDYTYNGTTLTLANFNNNQKKWDYVKCGRKGTASVGTITTKNAIAGTVSSVTVTVTGCTVSKVNKTYLLVATDKDFKNIVETVNATIKTGDVSYNISTPGSNYYYRLVFDCASGSSNGLVTISQVSYK